MSNDTLYKSVNKSEVLPAEFPKDPHPNLLKVILCINDQLQQAYGNEVLLSVESLMANQKYTLEGFEGIKKEYLIGKASKQIFQILVKLQDHYGLLSFNVDDRNFYNDPCTYVIYTEDKFYDAVNKINNRDKSEDKDKRLEELELQNRLLQEELSKLKEENSSIKAELEKKEDSRMIKSQNKILCGIIKTHYNNKSSRVSVIKDTLWKKSGINIDKKTIAKFIKEALKEDKSDVE